MVAGMLNLGDAVATHVCNCMKVQSAHNPLRYHVVPKAVGTISLVAESLIPADSTIRLKW